MNNLLIIIGSIFHIAFGVFHLLFWNLFGWKQDLADGYQPQYHADIESVSDVCFLFVCLPVPVSHFRVAYNRFGISFISRDQSVLAVARGATDCVFYLTQTVFVDSACFVRNWQRIVCNSGYPHPVSDQEPGIKFHSNAHPLSFYQRFTLLISATLSLARCVPRDVNRNSP